MTQPVYPPGEQGRGRGFATPLTRLVLRYAFEVAGLLNVMLHVLEPNINAARA